MQAKRTVQSVEKSLSSFFQQNRRMPTYSEMMDLLGVRSKSVVHFWVEKLLTLGLIEKDGKGFLKPKRRSLSVPVVGSVQAGLPTPAEQALQDAVSLDEYLIAKPEASFLLKVAGDSMIGEGIMEGDLVLVESGQDPKSGDIILAEVDGEWTIKFFRRRGTEVFLEAANPHYPLITAKTELKVGGIITAVIRKYHR